MMTAIQRDENVPAVVMSVFWDKRLNSGVGSHCHLGKAKKSRKIKLQMMIGDV